MERARDPPCQATSPEGWLIDLAYSPQSDTKTAPSVACSILSACAIDGITSLHQPEIVACRQPWLSANLD